jgi:hypothetical protein
MEIVILVWLGFLCKKIIHIYSRMFKNITLSKKSIALLFYCYNISTSLTRGGAAW